MSKLVVGISGCARVGKTTAANVMCDKMNAVGISSEIMSFAQPLKQGLETMGVVKEENHDLYRSLAQYIGTDVLRKHDGDWWVNVMARRIQESDSRIVFIDDVRFPNELRMIETYGGINVFVVGGDRIDLSRALYDHDSEKMSVKQELSARSMIADPHGTFRNSSGASVFILNHTTYEDFVGERMDHVCDLVTENINQSGLTSE